MKGILLAASIAALAGCAANSGIVPMGKDTYFVSRQAATGFPGLGNLKAEAIAEANQHCESQRKALEVANTTESKPPFILGNYPKVEVQFKCL
jgi:hypothetical protein